MRRMRVSGQMRKTTKLLTSNTKNHNLRTNQNLPLHPTNLQTNNSKSTKISNSPTNNTPLNNKNTT